MRLLLAIALALSVESMRAQTASAVPEAPEIVRAKAELRRIEELVEAGGLPRNRLEPAQEAVREAEDLVVLKRTLYGTLTLEDLTEELSKGMLDSARRLVSNQEAKVNYQRKLVENEVVGRTSLAPFVEELESRKATLALAEARVQLWTQLSEMARAEQQRHTEAEQAAQQSADDDASVASLPAARVRQLEHDFERVFSRVLPVSARGDTVFHRMLGFNHTGRIDVAVSPDSPEGQWLRNWLERTGIPHLVFRSAVRGQASAPHIHIGPPSTRLRIAD